MIAIQSVLCPVDFTPLSEKALLTAINACRRFGARLVIEHNLDPAPPYWMGVTWMWSESHEPDLERKGAHAELRLKEILDGLPPGMKGEAKLTRGPVVEGLLFVAGEVGADLIVMGSHGWSSPDHASITEQIIVSSPCPVLTVQAGDRVETLFADKASTASRAPCALVPFEPSEHGLAVARHALELAEEFSVRIVFLAIEAGDQESAGGEDSIPRIADFGGFEARIRKMAPPGLSARLEFQTGSGRPAEGILECCSRIHPALVVMGCHSGKGIRKLFSRSTSKEILHRSRCPVWFVSPAAVQKGAQPARAGS